MSHIFFRVVCVFFLLRLLSQSVGIVLESTMKHSKLKFYAWEFASPFCKRSCYMHKHIHNFLISKGRISLAWNMENWLSRQQHLWVKPHVYNLFAKCLLWVFETSEGPYYALKQGARQEKPSEFGSSKFWCVVSQELHPYDAAAAVYLSIMAFATFFMLCLTKA